MNLQRSLVVAIGMLASWACPALAALVLAARHKRARLKQGNPALVEKGLPVPPEWLAPRNTGQDCRESVLVAPGSAWERSSFKACLIVGLIRGSWASRSWSPGRSSGEPAASRALAACHPVASTVPHHHSPSRHGDRRPSPSWCAATGRWYAACSAAHEQRAALADDLAQGGVPAGLTARFQFRAVRPGSTASPSMPGRASAPPRRARCWWARTSASQPHACVRGPGTGSAWISGGHSRLSRTPNGRPSPLLRGRPEPRRGAGARHSVGNREDPYPAPRAARPPRAEGDAADPSRDDLESAPRAVAPRNRRRRLHRVARAAGAAPSTGRSLVTAALVGCVFATFQVPVGPSWRVARPAAARAFTPAAIAWRR
jgi:hypothetical protein